MNCWTICFLLVLASINFVSSDNVEESFKKADIIPCFIDAEYLLFLKVKYGEAEVNLGKELTPTQVKEMPEVKWEYKSKTYYLLAMIDLDVPTPTNHSQSEVIHWLAGNIPDDTITKADVIVEYVGSGPPKGLGSHRYVFFLFKQPGPLTFDERRIKVKGSAPLRMEFSIRKFAKKYKLGPPIAGNFFLAQYDESVNATLALLGA